MDCQPGVFSGVFIMEYTDARASPLYVIPFIILSVSVVGLARSSVQSTPLPFD